MEDFERAPAGWYPDPLGLPQLRWWDSTAWTEHTSQAKQPMVLQESRFAWADPDEEFPTRRARRERERARAGRAAEDEPTAVGLRELDPPRASDAEAGDEPDASGGSTAPAPQVAELREAVAAVSQTTGSDRAVRPDAGDRPLPDPVSPSTERPIPIVVPNISVHTAPVWILALLPLLQLVASLLVVSAFGMGGNLPLVLAIWAAPYLLTVLLATLDRTTLRRAGFPRPASWAWALLGAPVYLVVRAVRTAREQGNGFAPLLVWAALVLLQVGSIVAVPGILISALPSVFSAEAEQSVTADALITGARLEVDCPDTPPVLVGQEFTCAATSTTGSDYDVLVSLQRSNGWISWQVLDWGVFSLDR